MLHNLCLIFAQNAFSFPILSFSVQPIPTVFINHVLKLTCSLMYDKCLIGNFFISVLRFEIISSAFLTYLHFFFVKISKFHASTRHKTTQICLKQQITINSLFKRWHAGDVECPYITAWLYGNGVPWDVLFIPQSHSHLM